MWNSKIIPLLDVREKPSILSFVEYTLLSSAAEPFDFTPLTEPLLIFAYG